MPVPSLYKDGTISVENGSTAFTGTGTAWSTQLKRGTIIRVGTATCEVAEITADDAGQFFAGWPGETASGQPYVASTYSDGGEIAEAVRQMLTRILGRGMGLVVAGNPVAADHRDNDLIYSRANGTLYVRDMGIMKALLVPGGYDAYGDFGDGDRDAYDEEAAGFTFFATDQVGFYVLITPDESAAVWSDLVSIRGPVGEGDKYTLAIGVSGKPKNAEVLLRHEFEVEVTFAENLAGSRASSDDASSAAAVFSITKNGIEVGTLTFDTDDEGTFASNDPVVFAAGDILRVIAPSPADATLAAVSITLAGQR